MHAKTKLVRYMYVFYIKNLIFIMEWNMQNNNLQRKRYLVWLRNEIPDWTRRCCQNIHCLKSNWYSVKRHDKRDRFSPPPPPPPPITKHYVCCQHKKYCYQHYHYNHHYHHHIGYNKQYHYSILNITITSSSLSSSSISLPWFLSALSLFSTQNYSYFHTSPLE